jgi:methionyl-tRNA formyltransferase
MLQEVQQLLGPTGIPVIPVNKENNDAELKKAIKKYEVTLTFMMTYSYKIPSSIYKLPEKGFFNFHPGPLPEYRGGDPVFQQIKNQEKYAGVTVHYLDEGIDTGPVVIKEMVEIGATDTYGIVNNKLAEVATKLSGILVKMAGFDIGIPSRLQDETKAGYFKRQSARDIVIQWETMDANAVIALINACNPWNKGAVTSVNNKIIRFLEAEKLAETNSGQQEPGTILSIDADSINIAVIHHEIIRVHYIYIDEGFLKAGKLVYLGVLAGNRFVTV